MVVRLRPGKVGLRMKGGRHVLPDYRAHNGRPTGNAPVTAVTPPKRRIIVCTLGKFREGIADREAREAAGIPLVIYTTTREPGNWERGAGAGGGAIPFRLSKIWRLIAASNPS